MNAMLLCPLSEFQDTALAFQSVRCTEVQIGKDWIGKGWIHLLLSADKMVLKITAGPWAQLELVMAWLGSPPSMNANY